jgi:hypothetical protein
MVENIKKSLLEVDFASLSRRTLTPSPVEADQKLLDVYATPTRGPVRPS